ncbi:MAG TPA: nitrilase-related carbon-nitrogen hydrolase [candidate division Zixibacteria bacterium]|nr:nitrilase-related carbon-nitrogen hydrolase [candidate division Zixibacteria bacterium]
MKVGFIQFNPIFGDVQSNTNKTVKLINQGKIADLLVLPELCNTGYLFEDKSELEKLAERIPEGKTTKAWIKAAQDTNTYLVAGICEKNEEGTFFNSSVLIGPEGFIDIYRKIHLFNSEKNFFQPGKGPLKIYDIGLAKIGMMVCFDWAFPEIARILALNGAEIICHPSNLVLTYAQKAMLTRSIENKVFTITANRIGEDIRPNSKIAFTGNSQITSPNMEILAQAGAATEEVLIAEIDPAIAQNKMITPNNHIFLDRKTDLYYPLLNK